MLNILARKYVGNFIVFPNNKNTVFEEQLVVVSSLLGKIMCTCVNSRTVYGYN